MDGFKNSTKVIQGHHAWNGKDMPGYKTGGVVVPYKAPGRASTSAPRPIMPRPHVMPNMPKVSMPRKMARGGPVMQGDHDGGGGPYNMPLEGNSLEKANRPYSQIEVEHPRNDARPGYSKGGKKGGIHIKASHKGRFTQKMTGSKSGKLTGAMVSKGLKSGSASTRKQANFARMAKRHFKPLCEGGRAVGFAEGGKVGCDTDQMEGIAQRTVNRHVASKPPQGHGVRPKSNLAFMSKPMFGKG